MLNPGDYTMSMNKVVTLKQLKEWREIVDNVVVTNGCFDIIHVGHIGLIEYAKSQGDYLVIGVNSDKSVKKLKGKGRPINCLEDRCAILSHLQLVTVVYLFNEVNAARFLDIVKPNVYVKGGDYSLETLNKEELKVLKKHKTKIMFAPLVSGKSTTQIINGLGKT